MTAPLALIETVRVRNGAAPLWPLHLHRLATSCRALGVPFPPALDVPDGGPDRVHRLETSARGVTVSTRPVGALTPVRLAIAEAPHRPYPHKITERAPFDRALAEARAVGADDALLLTHGGDIAEAAIWGVFWWEGARLCAPPLELGILPGVARARLAEITGEIQERRCGPGGMTGRGLFLANAARGVVAVESLGGHPVVFSQLTERVAEAFWG